MENSSKIIYFGFSFAYGSLSSSPISISNLIIDRHHLKIENPFSFQIYCSFLKQEVLSVVIQRLGMLQRNININFIGISWIGIYFFHFFHCMKTSLAFQLNNLTLEAQLKNLFSISSSDFRTKMYCNLKEDLYNPILEFHVSVMIEESSNFLNSINQQKNQIFNHCPFPHLIICDQKGFKQILIQ